MIFASDLDRTLIYSHASMGDSVEPNDILPAELYEGKYISFMTARAVHLLKELIKKVAFVPVTTRTVEQYQRIFLIRDSFKPKYAITSNGGTILVDGIPDREWAQIILDSRNASAPHAEVKSLFDHISTPEWVIGFKFSDDLFFSIIMDQDKMPIDQINQFQKQLAGSGWTLSIQGRKMYLIPNSINKGSALLYVKTLLGSQNIASSGDSLLDESLLSVGDFALVPCHGELYNTKKDSLPFEFTQQSGIRASEEIILRASQWFNNVRLKREKESDAETYLV
jgi:hydroxymethylpyrimidine pyrophosphatase-like HAD family hydrolase